MILFALISCSKDEDAYFELSKQECAFNFAGGEEVINISSNQDWKVLNLPDWLTALPKEGSGSQSITLSCSYSSEAYSRISFPEFVSEFGRVSLRVEQEAGDYINLKSNVVEFSNHQEEKGVLVENNRDFTFSCDASWVHISSTPRLNGKKLLKSTRIYVSVDENIGEERTAELKVNGDKVSKTITIKQAAFIPLNNISIEEGEEICLYSLDKQELHILMNPLNTTQHDIEWSSSNTNIATVNEHGIINPITSGTTIITAKETNSSKSASITVFVRIPIKKAVLKLPQGGKFSYNQNLIANIEIEPKEAYTEDLKLYSSDFSIADAEGLTVKTFSKSGKGEFYLANESLTKYDTQKFEVKQYYASTFLGGKGNVSMSTTSVSTGFGGCIQSYNKSDKIEIQSVSLSGPSDPNGNNLKIYLKNNNSNCVYFSSDSYTFNVGINSFKAIASTFKFSIVFTINGEQKTETLYVNPNSTLVIQW